MKHITIRMISKFKNYLIEEEKSSATIEKYIRDITVFQKWLNGRSVEKNIVIEYKQALMEKYANTSVNSMLSSLNALFTYNEWFSCRVKFVKIQKQLFVNEEKELTKAEYERLLGVAKENKNEQLFLLMQTICSCGIRVSELKYITIEALKLKKACINLKGKIRTIILPSELCNILSKYAKERKISKGSIFISKSGKPLDRSNIWRMMKALCEKAKVAKEKVFPHNLRHLFARTFYMLQEDIVRLADILGHTNINTTRIYTIETGIIHREKIEKLGLLLC